jgi:hypothetical protein
MTDDQKRRLAGSLAIDLLCETTDPAEGAEILADAKLQFLQLGRLGPAIAAELGKACACGVVHKDLREASLCPLWRMNR